VEELQLIKFPSLPSPSLQVCVLQIQLSLA